MSVESILTSLDQPTWETHGLFYCALRYTFIVRHVSIGVNNHPRWWNLERSNLKLGISDSRRGSKVTSRGQHLRWIQFDFFGLVTYPLVTRAYPTLLKPRNRMYSHLMHWYSRWNRISTQQNRFEADMHVQIKPLTNDRSLEVRYPTSYRPRSRFDMEPASVRGAGWLRSLGIQMVWDMHLAWSEPAPLTATRD